MSVQKTFTCKPLLILGGFLNTYVDLLGFLMIIALKQIVSRSQRLSLFCVLVQP